jgi:glyoxylase-like metal-dependent hydrolase (beta-lactamase superfamily II)
MKARFRAVLYASFIMGSTNPNLFAAAPMVKSQPPMFYRAMLGDFEITALGDGTQDFPMDKLLSGDPKTNKSLLESAFLDSPVETSVTAYLINTGRKLILVDTGAAKIFGPTGGMLLPNLKAAGYDPSQIDEVYITHLHPDHIGGLASEGAMVFPNAILRAHDADLKFWMAKDNMDRAPEENKGFFKAAQAALEPYSKAGKLKGFSTDVELSPGVKAQATVGHTAGHTSYVVESKGKRLIIIGDLIHAGSIQLPKPEVTIAFDSDPKAAAAMRKKIFNEAVKDKSLVAAAHLPFPGLGHLTANGKGYSWIPLNYGRIN